MLPRKHYIVVAFHVIILSRVYEGFASVRTELRQRVAKDCLVIENRKSLFAEPVKTSKLFVKLGCLLLHPYLLSLRLTLFKSICIVLMMMHIGTRVILKSRVNEARRESSLLVISLA